MRLSRISSYIVCNTYGIAPWDGQQPRHHGDMAGRAARHHVDRAMHMLDDWHATLPVSLQLGAEHLSTDAVVCNLHMTRNQLVVLTARPIVFVAVKKAVAERLIGRRTGRRGGGAAAVPGHHHQGHLSPERHVGAGLTAARWNMRIGRWLRDLYGNRRRLFHVELHCVFNAAVLIILEALLSVPPPSSSSSPSPASAPSLPPLDEDVRCAIEIFDDDARGGSNYSKDCCRVLTDFSTLARRLAASLAWSGGQDVPPVTRQKAQQQQNPMPLARTLPDEAAAGMHPWTAEAFDPAVMRPMQGHHHPHGASAFEPGGGVLYEELINWMETDDMQLYSTFLI